MTDEDETVKALIEKYNIRLRSDGKLSGGGAHIHEQDNLLLRMKPQIVKYLQEKEEIEKAEYVKTQKEFEAGTLPIVVKRITHFSSALDQEITENVVDGDFNFLSEIYSSVYVTFSTDIPEGVHPISDLPEWKKWKGVKDMEKARNEYISASGKTLVRLNRCWECGHMKILGGQNGRLPYDVYKNALDELAAILQKEFQDIPKNVLLSSAPKPKSTGPFGFDFESPRFIFEIISDTYDGC